MFLLAACAGPDHLGFDQPDADDLRAVPADGPAWMAAEAPVLYAHRQVTARDEYYKAGESYFDATGRRVLFQAVPVGAGQPSPHYSMYAADLRLESGRALELVDARQISPDGSASTCGWFHPDDSDLVMFGCTVTEPDEDNVPGYQRSSGRYRWAFPTEMQLVTVDLSSEGRPEPETMLDMPGYDAEGSWSPDGRHVLFANVDEAKSAELGITDADLWVLDTTTGERTKIVDAPGYDGGPFFSPDGTWICYRSDRRGNNLLQIFIAELAFDEDGAITGIEREVAITDNWDVNWAPYWHPSGRFLVFSSSLAGHDNYEVYAVEALDEDGEPVSLPSPVRVTHAAGFDGLPVFSRDGRFMMWTAQRGPVAEGEEKPTSQLWIARFDAEAMMERLRSGG